MRKSTWQFHGARGRGRLKVSPVDEQNGGFERGASLWTARGSTPLFPRLGSGAQIHRCPAKQPSASPPRGAFRDFVHRSSAKPKRGQASAVQSLAALTRRAALAQLPAFGLPLNHARRGRGVERFLMVHSYPHFLQACLGQFDLSTVTDQIFVRSSSNTSEMRGVRSAFRPPSASDEIPLRRQQTARGPVRCQRA